MGDGVELDRHRVPEIRTQISALTGTVVVQAEPSSAQARDNVDVVRAQLLPQGSCSPASSTGRTIAAELKLPTRLYDMGRQYKDVSDEWIGFASGLNE